MTKFELEMTDFLSSDTLLLNKVFYDKMVTGELNKDVVVKISFESGIQADYYYGLTVKIINKKNGIIDTQFFKFNNILNNADSRKSYYIWTSDYGSDWYRDTPTKSQKEKFMRVIYNYIKLYK